MADSYLQNDVRIETCFCSKKLPVTVSKPVQLRCLFLALGPVDSARELFEAEVVLQATWREPQLDKGPHDLSNNAVDLKSLWNPRIRFLNATNGVRDVAQHHVEYRQLTNGHQEAYLVEVRRLKGVFTETLELKYFPFDAQDLTITVSSEWSTNEVNFVESRYDISRIVDDVEVASQEWNIHTHVEVVNSPMHMENEHLGCNLRRPVIKFYARASRRFSFFVINIMMISIIFCGLSMSVFAIQRPQVQSRLQLSFFLLLTIVSFKSFASQALPKVPYLTSLDKMLLWNMLFVVVGACWHTTVWKADEEDEAITERENIVIYTLAGVYLVFLCLFIILHATYVFGFRRRLFKKDEEFRVRLQECREAMKKPEIFEMVAIDGILEWDKANTNHGVSTWK